MGHITTWEEDYKGNNNCPSLQSPLANSSYPNCSLLAYAYCLQLLEKHSAKILAGSGVWMAPTSPAASSRRQGAPLSHVLAEADQMINRKKTSTIAIQTVENQAK
jgi:hypothetical protein